MYKSKTY